MRCSLANYIRYHVRQSIVLLWLIEDLTYLLSCNFSTVVEVKLQVVLDWIVIIFYKQQEANGCISPSTQWFHICNLAIEHTHADVRLLLLLQNRNIQTDRFLNRWSRILEIHKRLHSWSTDPGSVHLFVHTYRCTRMCLFLVYIY